MKITLGICAYNEEKNIAKLLDNLITKQNLPPNSEIMVVCSGCTDSTPEVVKRLQEMNGQVKLILENERRGKATALNVLLGRVRHTTDVLVLVNADTFPSIDSLNKLIQPFNDDYVGATFGRPIPINGQESPPNSIVHIIWDLHHKISLYKWVKMSGEFCAIRPSLVKGIPINLATDEPYMEMLIQRQGYRITYVPDAVVYIKGPENFRDLLKQRRRIWTGHLQIKKLTGYTVSTSDPRKILSVLAKSLRLNFKGLTLILLGAVLEVCAYLLARYDLNKGWVPYKWEMLGSTKVLNF